MLILINNTEAREKTLNVDMIKSYALTNDEVSWHKRATDLIHPIMYIIYSSFER
jgi:hypothetical protein